MAFLKQTKIKTNNNNKTDFIGLFWILKPFLNFKLFVLSKISKFFFFLTDFIKYQKKKKNKKTKQNKQNKTIRKG